MLGINIRVSEGKDIPRIYLQTEFQISQVKIQSCIE